MNDTVNDAASDGQIPESFKNEERRRIEARHKALRIENRGTDLYGLALSGGGIRSATISLGFLQGLAHRNRLCEFDYLSTVSGGGYTGSFYGSLHVPHGKRGNAAAPGNHAQKPPEPDDAYQDAAREAAKLKDGPPGRDPANWKSPVQFLRDNGNYLAPNGGGDFMLALAVGVRNWIAVQYLIAVSLVTILFFMSALRSVAPGLLAVEKFFQPGDGAVIWWSPWWLVPAAILVFALIPLGGAYWLAENDRTSDSKGGKILRMLPSLALLIMAGGALCRALQWRWPSWPLFDSRTLDADPVGAACWVIVVSAAISTAIYFGCKLGLKGLANVHNRRARVDRLRNLLTNAFVTAPKFGKDVLPLSLVPMFIASVAVAAIDTLGQSVLLWLAAHIGAKLAPGAAFGAGLIVVVQLLAKNLDEKAIAQARKIPLTVAAGLAAALLALLTLTVWSLTAHAMLSCFKPYSIALAHQDAIVDGCTSFWRGLVDFNGETDGKVLTAIGVMFAALMILAIVCGWSIGFLNLSSLQRLYSTRLTRAYLGASNPHRLANPDLRDVSELIDGDNVEMRDYFAKGMLAPLHLINVTLNTTVAWGAAGTQSDSANRARATAADSKLVHRNNRGMSMCVGPAGISVGASYAHLQCDWEHSDAVATPVSGYFGAGALGVPKDRDDRLLYLVESLSLGDWCAISGAALSTGLGANTRTGLSVILGVANIRLGYWWNSSVTIWNWKKYGAGRKYAAGGRPALLPSIMPRGRVLSTIYRSLSTQLCLLSELIGRFYGPRRRRWYLTDGGHFENTAAYELVRRRLKLIVMLDNGADHDYRFGDLANLIRRVRLDFGIEIAEVWTPVDCSLFPFRFRSDVFTTSDEVQDKKWGDAFALCFSMTDTRTGERFGHLIAIKPRVPGYAPVDIRQYAGACDFPQQSTLQQFFDEAEWESYRKLGEVMATRLFDVPGDERPAQEERDGTRIEKVS
ncbi:patatin-like phospholipase family protein [Paraburkholderia sp. SIMBA_049]